LLTGGQGAPAPRIESSCQAKKLCYHLTRYLHRISYLSLPRSSLLGSGVFLFSVKPVAEPATEEEGPLIALISLISL